MKKKYSKSWYADKLDVLFSKVVRTRDGKCLRCDKKDTLQCAHIASRRHLAGRWDEHNAITLCYACHIHWAHKEPIEFSEWLKVTHPFVWEHSQEVKGEVCKMSLEDYENLHKELTARLEALEKRV
jgi:hypothetical protein